MTENVIDFTKYLISLFYCNIYTVVSSSEYDWSRGPEATYNANQDYILMSWHMRASATVALPCQQSDTYQTQLARILLPGGVQLRLTECHCGSSHKWNQT